MGQSGNRARVPGTWDPIPGTGFGSAPRAGYRAPRTGPNAHTGYASCILHPLQIKLGRDPRRARFARSVGAFREFPPPTCRPHSLTVFPPWAIVICRYGSRAIRQYGNRAMIRVRAPVLYPAYPVCAFSSRRARSSALGADPVPAPRCQVPGTWNPVPGTCLRKTRTRGLHLFNQAVGRAPTGGERGGRPCVASSGTSVPGTS
jgi:hypothetical protein